MGAGSEAGWRVASSSLLLALALLHCVAGVRAYNDEGILLAFRNAIDNWEDVYEGRQLQGWAACEPGRCVPVCSWSGVTCDPYVQGDDDNRVTAVELPCIDGCAVPAVGRLPPQLAQMHHLQTLDLQGNTFYGGLPPEWGADGTFPELTTLNLNSNNLSGPLVDAWAVNHGFPSLAVLHLADNSLTGPLTEAWATTNTSFTKLLVWNLANNQLTGTLPEFINGMVTMSMVALQGNQFTGGLPSEWGRQGWYWNGTYNVTQELQQLYLHDNLLNGTLPDAWAAPDSFTALKMLTLGQNPLATAIPQSWMAAGAWPVLESLNISHAELVGTLPEAAGGLPRLEALTIDGNNLSGSIPSSWGEGLPSLNRAIVQPGNEGLCTQAPAGAAFQLCSDYDQWCQNPLTSSSSPSCSMGTPGGGASSSSGGDDGGSDASPSGEGSSSSSVPLAAIVAPIAAVAAASLAALAFVLLQRSRQQGQALGKAPGSLQGGSGTGFKPDIAFPPSELAFHEEASVWGGKEGVSVSKLDSDEFAELGQASGAGAAGVGSGPQQADSALQRAESGSLARSSRQSSLGCGAATCLPWCAQASSAEEDQAAAQQPQAGMARVPPRTSFHSARTSRDLRQASAAGSCATSAAAASGGPGIPRPSSTSRLAAAGIPRPGSAGRLAAAGLPRPSSASRLAATSALRGSGACDREAWPHNYDQSPSSTTATASLSSGRSGRLHPGSSGTAQDAFGGYEAALPQAVRLSMEISLEMDRYVSDWEIPPEEIEILKRPDGTPWRLGAGGFGTVYKAMRNGVQPVAVKVLSAPIKDLQRMSQTEFQHEIAILRACRSPAIVQFQGVCARPNETMLVTEYMEGGNLLSNIRSQRVSWYRKGKRIAIEVARGLAFLHSKKIVHFDIKSANILLTRDGSAKLADVGMAKIMTKDYITGAVGTLAWSAPEMLWGHKCTTKADVYSFGVVCWEIVTGEHPVRGQLRDMRVPEECPGEVRDIILWCLEPDPTARPTAVQLVEWLINVPATPPGSQTDPRDCRDSANSMRMALKSSFYRGSQPPLEQQQPTAGAGGQQPGTDPTAQRPASESSSGPVQHELRHTAASDTTGTSAASAGYSASSLEEEQQQQQQQQQRQEPAPATSLSLASPFALAAQQQQQFGGGGAPAVHAGAPVPKQQPARLASSALARQRTAHGLLPVQGGLDADVQAADHATPGCLDHASSQLPTPIGNN